MSVRLTISLPALAANYRTLQAQAGCAVAAVVKANGYGMGAEQVARCLADRGCDEFFVATVAEGAKLRGTLPTATIYVLEGALPDSIAQLRTCRLLPVLNSPAQVQMWTPEQLPAAVHVDTGMQRLGMSFADAAALFTQAPFAVPLLLTHLSRADEPGHPFNHQQIDTFQQGYRKLRSRFAQAVPRRLSVCNSAAMLADLLPVSRRVEQADYLGRGGIALYGGNPFAHKPNPMQPVAALQARVLQVRRVRAGEPVGYGGAYVAGQPRRIATVAAGYADGVSRLLSDRGQVWIAGSRCPIVGRVSMDMLHVDVTAKPDVDESSWVEVLGANVSIDEVAAHASTISYEVLTGLGRRGQIVYSDKPL